MITSPPVVPRKYAPPTRTYNTVIRPIGSSKQSVGS
jgi:hypothetical protein